MNPKYIGENRFNNAAKYIQDDLKSQKILIKHHLNQMKVSDKFYIYKSTIRMIIL